MVRIAVCGARRGNSCRQLRVTQGDNGDSDARNGVRNYLRKSRKVYAHLVKSCMESQTEKRGETKRTEDTQVLVHATYHRVKLPTVHASPCNQIALTKPGPVLMIASPGIAKIPAPIIIPTASRVSSGQVNTFLSCC